MSNNKKPPRKPIAPDHDEWLKTEIDALTEGQRLLQEDVLKRDREIDALRRNLENVSNELVLMGQRHDAEVEAMTEKCEAQRIELLQLKAFKEGIELMMRAMGLAKPEKVEHPGWNTGRNISENLIPVARSMIKNVSFPGGAY